MCKAACLHIQSNHVQDSLPKSWLPVHVKHKSHELPFCPAPEITVSFAYSIQKLYNHPCRHHRSATNYHRYTSTTNTYSQTSNISIMTTNPNLLFALENISKTPVQTSSIPTTVATPLGPHRTLARAKDLRHGCINGVKISTCKKCAGHVLRGLVISFPCSTSLLWHVSEQVLMGDWQQRAMYRMQRHRICGS